MKTLVLFLLAALIAAAAAVLMVRSDRVNSTKAQLAAAEQAVQEQAARVRELEESKQLAEAERQKLTRLADEIGAELRAQTRSNELAASIAKAQAASPEKSAPAGQGNNLGKLLGQMMNDPDTKEFVRKQQRMMLDNLYAPLVKQLGLTPEESQLFKDMVATNMLRGAERATAMFAGSQSERAEAMKTMARDHESGEAELKAFLGDERYDLYKEYSATIGERTQLNTFRQQFSGEHPITDQQSEQLLAIMAEEKKSLAPELAAMTQGQNPQNIQAMLDEGQLDKFVSAQETLNARVLERAGTLLSPEQLGAFSQFQTTQLQTMRMGMKMARKMFGEPATGTESTGPR